MWVSYLLNAVQNDSAASAACRRYMATTDDMQIVAGEPSRDDYYNLGSYKRAITTSSPQAQLWFNRGLIWSYGFNHQAAEECFQKAIAHDGKCAMAYWGLAYALGANYNKQWEVFDKTDLESTLKRTYDAAKKANELADASVTPVERALCHAIQFRYPMDRAVEDLMSWNKSYSDAMEKVYRDHSEDLDVVALYADALVNLTPWRMWDVHTGKPNPEARTMQVKQILEKGFEQTGGLQHPGSLHLYIHLMEMSPHPEAALPVADHLRGLCPDAGHLEHMPTHLDVLCGDWQRSIASNSDAIRADEKYVRQVGAANFYTLYRCHDYHFKLYGAMFAGQSKVSLQTAAQLAVAIPEELLRVESPPMADWLEGFVAMQVHAYIRFGKWKEILDLPLPTDQELYCSTTAVMFYAKGVAASALGQIEDAESYKASLRDAVPKVKPSRTIFNNTCHDILQIADAMLCGELEYRKKNFDVAFAHLRHAVRLDDSLPYDEPWGWLQPTRHALGALLLEQNHVDEAAKVYAADLGLDDSLPRPLQHPNNVWSLHGYCECLRRMERHSERTIIEEQLKMALAMADVEIVASCYCRRNGGA